jgi:hypothetical protein
LKTARPVLTVAAVMKLLHTTKSTAGRCVELLVKAGVLAETTGRKRDRTFVYQAYLDRLSAGGEVTDHAAPRARRQGAGPRSAVRAAW